MAGTKKKVPESKISGEAYMIFLSVGSENFSFNRLIRIIDNEAGDKMSGSKFFAQIGKSTYKPLNMSYTDFLPYNKSQELIRESEIIIIHAGVGTIINCFENERIPIIFPRLKKHKEQIDNHQLELARRLEKENMILAAYDEDGLVNKIRCYHKLVKNMKFSKNNNKKTLINNLFNVIKR